MEAINTFIGQWFNLGWFVFGCIAAVFSIVKIISITFQSVKSWIESRMQMKYQGEFFDININWREELLQEVKELTAIVKDLEHEQKTTQLKAHIVILQNKLKPNP